MDTLIMLDCGSWFCQSTLYDMIIDIIWRNSISKEVRAYDDTVSILDTDDAEHTVISECIRIDIPQA